MARSSKFLIVSTSLRNAVRSAGVKNLTSGAGGSSVGVASGVVGSSSL